MNKLILLVLLFTGVLVSSQEVLTYKQYRAVQIPTQEKQEFKMVSKLYINTAKTEMTLIVSDNPDLILHIYITSAGTRKLVEGEMMTVYDISTKTGYSAKLYEFDDPDDGYIFHIEDLIIGVSNK